VEQQTDKQCHWLSHKTDSRVRIFSVCSPGIQKSFEETKYNKAVDLNIIENKTINY